MSEQRDDDLKRALARIQHLEQALFDKATQHGLALARIQHLEQGALNEITRLEAENQPCPTIRGAMRSDTPLPGRAYQRSFKGQTERVVVVVTRRLFFPEDEDATIVTFSERDHEVPHIRRCSLATWLRRGYREEPRAGG